MTRTLPFFFLVSLLVLAPAPSVSAFNRFDISDQYASSTEIITYIQCSPASTDTYSVQQYHDYVFAGGIRRVPTSGTSAWIIERTSGQDEIYVTGAAGIVTSPGGGFTNFRWLQSNNGTAAMFFRLAATATATMTVRATCDGTSASGMMAARSSNTTASGGNEAVQIPGSVLNPTAGMDESGVFGGADLRGPGTTEVAAWIIDLNETLTTDPPETSFDTLDELGGYVTCPGATPTLVEGTYHMNLTPRNIGGAYYSVINRSHIQGGGAASNFHLYGFDGEEAVVDTLVAGTFDSVYLVRWGYLEPPYNGTFDTGLRFFPYQGPSTPSGGGFRWCTLNNPPEPSIHLAPRSSGHAYVFLTENTRDVALDVYVLACTDAECGTAFEPIEGAAVTVYGAQGRYVTDDITDADGLAEVASAGYLGNTVTVCAEAVGYYDGCIESSIPGVAGTYTIEIDLLPVETDLGGGVGSTTLEFSGNTSRVIPDRVSINMTRNRPDAIYVDCVRLDLQSQAFSSACMTDHWAATDTNSREFLYPGFGVTSAVNVGSYVLYGVDVSTGLVLNDTTFCIASTYLATCDQAISESSLAQMAADTILETAANGIGVTSDGTVSALTLEQHVRNAIDFAFRPFVSCDLEEASWCDIPNIAWWYFGTLILFGMGIAGRVATRK